MSDAEANSAWVRDRIAARGLTQQIESMAALALVAGYSTWFACQQHMNIISAGQPNLRTSGEWAS